MSRDYPPIELLRQTQWILPAAQTFCQFVHDLNVYSGLQFYRQSQGSSLQLRSKHVFKIHQKLLMTILNLGEQLNSSYYMSSSGD